MVVGGLPQGEIFGVAIGHPEDMAVSDGCVVEAVLGRHHPGQRQGGAGPELRAAGDLSQDLIVGIVEDRQGVQLPAFGIDDVALGPMGRRVGEDVVDGDFRGFESTVAVGDADDPARFSVGEERSVFVGIGVRIALFEAALGE